MTRIAHYVSSTHWDREWYEPFQGYRMRLVSLLDEVLETLQKDPGYRTFVMDGQAIPILDYLEVRPEKRELIGKFVREGRIRLGPWFVLPDEFIVSGESLIRNLQKGIAISGEEFATPSSRAGFLCDMFGHTSQMPQILSQMGIPMAFIWRGITEKENGGNSIWKASDGTEIPIYRFGRDGYCTFSFEVRQVNLPESSLTEEQMAAKLVEFTLAESRRSDISPILIFDGGDHLEIEPRISKVIFLANKILGKDGIKIVHSDLDKYMADVIKEKKGIRKTLNGELRTTAKEIATVDNQWMLSGTLSSRIHLKQRNAVCEDELCLWAEPFSAFACNAGEKYPAGYLQAAWRHLLENHAHDSICGCSLDQVHQDMIFRFDQSIGISKRLTGGATRAIAMSAAPRDLPDGAMALTVFNNSSKPVDEPVDLEIPLPTDWSGKFLEFLGYEEKFSFKLIGPDGKEIPYQLVSQEKDRAGFKAPRYHFVQYEGRHIVNVTAKLNVPAYGYSVLRVEPCTTPVRHHGKMACSHRAVENEYLRVQVNQNGTLCIQDKRTGKSFDQLLTFEEQADIGDGWYHGLAVNDQIFSNSASGADVAIIADGRFKATLRIAVTMNVPGNFDFKSMTRSQALVPLKIVSDVTLRAGTDRIEIETAVENNVLDHRLRVLFPTDLDGKTYFTDTAFDVVGRQVPLPPDSHAGRELDVEYSPQCTWSAFGDGKAGLAVVSRGLPETAVRDTEDRPIALTLFRSFRKAIFSNDNAGGQIQGRLKFNYTIVPFKGGVPVLKLLQLGQVANGSVRSAALTAKEIKQSKQGSKLQLSQSFLSVSGDAVVTSVQRQADKLLVRMFNPFAKPQDVRLGAPYGIASAKSVTLDGRNDKVISVDLKNGSVHLTLPAKRIATIIMKIGKTPAKAE